ncbi:MAG: ABC transporter substrate-binding protein [Anaerolineae bacterium]
MRKYVSFVLLVLLLLALATVSLAQEEKVLVYGLAENSDSLDPARGYTPQEGTVNHATYETLVTWPVNDNSEVLPGLAESWTISEDGLTYTFILRSGVTFNDGSALAASDVVFTIQRLQGIGGNPSFLAENIASVEAPDDSTVVITLSQSDPAILAKLASAPFSIVSEAIVTANGGTTTADDAAEGFLNSTSAGTGPYVLESWEQGVSTVLVRNQNYYGEAPYFDRIIFQNIPEAATQAAALQTGDIDVAADITADQVASLTANGDVAVSQVPTPIIMFLLFNQNEEIGGPVSNPLVQRAIRYAVDYQSILALTAGSGVQPPSVIPAGWAGALPNDAVITRDVAMASSLLAEAGYADGFSIDLQYPEYTLQGVAIGDVAQIVQANLAEVGITVNLAPGELLAELDLYRGGQEGLGLWWWGPDFQDALSNLEFLPNRIVGNRVNWTDDNSDETIRSLRDQAFVEVDPAARAELVQQIQSYLQENGPFAPLVQVGRQIGYRADITGMNFNPQWDIDVTLLGR